MKRFTPRQLIDRFLGETHISQPRVDEAVRRARKGGWVLGCHPQSQWPERVVVAVRWPDPMLPLLWRTYAASLEAGDRHVAELPRGTVESRVGDLRQPAAGRALARFGLLLMRPADVRTVKLRGASPLLAGIVNGLRYGGSRRGRDHAILIQAAWGEGKRPQRLGALGEDTLLEAAELYERLGIDASGLLDRTPRSHPRSRWRLPDLLGSDED